MSSLYTAGAWIRTIGSKIFHNRIMNDLGWNMYYYSLPYHFEREPENSLYSGELMISANIDRTIESTRQAIVDLRALIHWIKANKKALFS